MNTFVRPENPIYIENEIAVRKQRRTADVNIILSSKSDSRYKVHSQLV